jgi:hypothetical protein
MTEAELFRAIDDAAELARRAFAVGDVVAGIAAICLASDLVRLARALGRLHELLA